MSKKTLYRIGWIVKTRSGITVQESSVYASNMIAACSQIKKRENFVDLLSAKLYGSISNKYQSISTAEEYEILINKR